MQHIILVLALIGCGILGKMWWDEKNSERPILPPSFIESRIKQTALVPITEQISKVYAVCPTDKTFLGFGGSPMYLMSWTARVNYKIDLAKINISEVIMNDGKEWIISAPEIEILNSGNNLIDENDHYKFNNDALIAKSKDALIEHYKKERERAEDIALYTANWRIHNDSTLTEAIKDQLKLIFYSQIAQVSEQKVDFDKVTVSIAPPTKILDKPNSPDLCENQPFKTNLGLSELE